MEVFSIASVASITVIAYLFGEVAKASAIDNKWICGIVGAVLGVVGLKAIADFPANDIVTAIAVGIVSGLAATGANQIVKQLSGK